MVLETHGADCTILPGSRFQLEKRQGDRAKEMGLFERVVFLYWAARSRALYSLRI